MPAKWVLLRIQEPELHSLSIFRYVLRITSFLRLNNLNTDLSRIHSYHRNQTQHLPYLDMRTSKSFCFLPILE